MKKNEEGKILTTDILEKFKFVKEISIDDDDEEYITWYRDGIQLFEEENYGEIDSFIPSFMFAANPTEYRNNIQTASLDRIKSNKGYEKDNVQWLHKKVNLMKNILEEKDFINICKLIATNNE